MQEGRVQEGLHGAMMMILISSSWAGELLWILDQTSECWWIWEDWRGGEAGRGEAGIRMRMIIGDAFDTWWSYLPVSIILQLIYSILSILYHTICNLYIINLPSSPPSHLSLSLHCTASHCNDRTRQVRLLTDLRYLAIMSILHHFLPFRTSASPLSSV